MSFDDLPFNEGANDKIMQTSKMEEDPKDTGSQSVKEGGVPEAIRKVQKHHSHAYRHISGALKLDESTSCGLEGRVKAVELYGKGIKELERGLAITLDGQGSEWDRARILQSKMCSNLEHARLRVDELGSVIQSEVEADRSKPDNERVGSVSAKPRTAGIQKPGPTARSLGNRMNGIRPLPASSGSPVARKSVIAPARGRVSTRVGMKEPTKEEEKKISNLRNVDSKHANVILNEVVEKGRGVTFDDIGGIGDAKQILQEIVILPTLNPELFTGLRAPARGLLIFGPPGTGKTLLAKAVATEADSTFFNISAATLTSKFVGESEKMVKALFAVAREVQPAIIFIDEIDSLLSERKESEHDATRRMKTEFLLAFDGLSAEADERILVMGATNRPWEIDDAALRRFPKRVYVPLPDKETRKEILHKLIAKQRSELTERDLDSLAKSLENYSGSDIAALARDAALMPIRELSPEQIRSLPPDKVRGITFADFKAAMRTIRPSVSGQHKSRLEEWNSSFGSLPS